MEAEKLQRLHDVLNKLAPKGKVGGLGFNSFVKQTKSKNDGLPNNALYSRFVRAGQGSYHKHEFEEPEIVENKEKDKKKTKKLKKKKSKDDSDDIDLKAKDFEPIEANDEETFVSLKKSKRKKGATIEEDFTDEIRNENEKVKKVKKKKLKTEHSDSNSESNFIVEATTDSLKASEIRNKQILDFVRDVDTLMVIDTLDRLTTQTLKKKKKKKKRKEEDIGINQLDNHSIAEEGHLISSSDVSENNFKEERKKKDKKKKKKKINQSEDATCNIDIAVTVENPVVEKSTKKNKVKK